MWNWLKQKLGGQPAGSKSESKTALDSMPQLPWIAAKDNPLGVDVLDVRPVTQTYLSTSESAVCAQNSVSFSNDDGTGFIGVEPADTRVIETNLRYPIDRMLLPGALFIPQCMEEKWAIYFHGNKIICIRSWQRLVVFVAETRVIDNSLEVTQLRGRLTGPDETPDETRKLFDYLIQSHVLDIVAPVPLPHWVAAEPAPFASLAALWCMSMFGNRSWYATPHAFDSPPVTVPIRSHSLFHIAVARNDTATVNRYLDEGVPTDLLARDGLAALHWALATPNTEMLRHLLDRGADVNVRSVEGATPLMNAVQSRNLENTLLLLDRGADANAADSRGFTALHRAAEMGQFEIAQLLLNRGARRDVLASGRTPLDLAESRNETRIVELLRNE